MKQMKRCHTYGMMVVMLLATCLSLKAQSNFSITVTPPTVGENRFSVCGGERFVRVMVQNITTPSPGDTLKNITATLNLSTVPGLVFSGNIVAIGGVAVSTSSSYGSSAPVINVVNLDTSGSFALFDVGLEPNCTAIGLATSSGTPNFNTIVNFTKNGLILSQSKNSGNFGVVKPTLSIPVIQGNPLNGVPKTGGLGALLDPIKGMVDTIRTTVVNAGFGALNSFVYWVIDNPALTLQKVMVGNYQLVPITTIGDTTFFLVPAAAIAKATTGVGSFPNNTSQFQFNEQLVFTEYWYADDCITNSPDIIRGVRYGCDGTSLANCEQASAASGIRFGIRRPILSTLNLYQIPYFNTASSIEYRESTPACYTDGVKAIFAIVNSGSGPASDVRFNLSTYPGEWNRSVDTATSQIKIGRNGTWQHINAWKTTNNSQLGSCPSTAQTIRRANYELKNGFMLNPGDTLFIRYTSNYTCGCNSLSAGQCGTMWYYYYNLLGWEEGNGDVNFNDQNTYKDPCNLGTWTLPRSNQTNFVANMPNFPQGSPNISAGQTNTNSYNFTSFSNSWLDNYLGTGRRSDYDNATIRFYYEIDAGLDWTGANGDVNTSEFKFIGANNASLWKPTSVKYTDNGFGQKDTLIVDFAFKDYTYASNIGALKALLNYKSDCGEIPVACKTGKRIREWITFNPSTTCASCTQGSSGEQPVGCYVDWNINIYCVCQPCVGINPLAFKVERKNYEFGDNNNNHRFDAGETIDTALIQKKRFISGDTIRASYKAVFKTDATHLQWENAYNVINVPTTVPTMSITPVGANVVIKDVNAAGTLTGTYTANILEQFPQGNQIYTNLSPDKLKSLGNASVPASFTSYSDGDTVEVEVLFRVFDSTYYRIWQDPLFQLEFSENSFASHTSMPVAAAGRFACDAFNDRVVYLKMKTWSYAWGEWQMDLGGCTPGNIDNYYTGFTIGENGSFDYFPYEIRVPKAEPIQSMFVKAPGLEWNNLVVDIGTEWDDPAAVNFNPATSSYITVVGDTMYFNSRQYMIDFRTANPTIRFDQGYYIHFAPQVTGTCKVPVSTTFITNSSSSNNFATDPNVFGTNHLDNLTKLTITPSRNDAELGIFYRQYKYRYINSANLVVQTGTSTQVMLGDETCFEVQISNVGESDALLTWLNLRSPSGGVIINSVKEVTNPALPVTFTPTLGVYRIGNTAKQGTQIRTFQFCVSTNNCVKDSIVLQAGWNCTGYPRSLAEADCGTPFKFYIVPAVSTLDMIVKQPDALVTTDLCTDQDYYLQITSASLGSLSNINLQFTLPDGQTYIPGSFQYAYPVNTADPLLATYSNAINPTNITGNIWQINVSQAGTPINTTLTTSGLPGTTQLGQNYMFVKFKTRLGCGYENGGNLDFLSWAYDACGNLANYKSVPAYPIKINGLPEVFKSEVDVTSSAINPCINDAKRINIEFAIQPGSVPTAGGDSIRVILPPGMNYNTGSYIAGQNAATNPPIVINNNGINVLYFAVPAGLSAGTIVKFSFEAISQDAQQDCRNYPLKVQTFSSQNATCTIGGVTTTCAVRSISDETVSQISFVKPDLSFTAFSASSQGVPNNQESISYSLTVKNNGEAIPAGATTTVEIYSDVNNNGDYDPAIDIFLFNATSTFAIATGASLTMTGSALVPAGKSCNLLAMVNPSTTCVCTRRVSFQVHPDIQMPFNRNVIACSNQTLTNIGPPAFTTGSKITYEWFGYNGAATTPLSSTTTSPVNFTLNNQTSMVLNNTYVIRVIRNNDCISYDSITVRIFPVAKDSVTTQTCAGTAASVTSPSNGSNYVWTSTPAANIATPNAFSSVITGGITQNTRFVVNYTDSNGCAATFIDNKSVVFCAATALGDTVWYDLNKNGIQDAGEPPIAGIVVQLYDPANLTSPIRSTVTDANGFYIFDTIPAGNYRVKFILPTGKNAKFTKKDAGSNDLKDSDADTTTGFSPVVYVPNGTRNMSLDAGIYYSGTLGNYVWYDDNGDGLQNEAANRGINGVKVYLYKDNGTGTFVKADSLVTANDASGNPGYYLFKNLDNGNYKVLFPTSQNSGNFPLTTATQTAFIDGNSDANVATGYSGVAVINVFGTPQDINNTTVDAGYKTNIGSIGNYIWTDTNGDGLQNEPAANGINGVKVYLYKPGPSGVIGAPDQILVDSTTTSNDASGNAGYYSFNNLPSGNFYVKFPTTNSGYPLSPSNQTATTDGNSDANVGTGYSGLVNINVNGTGQAKNNTTIDAGYRTNIGSIGNFVWLDNNADGIQNEGVLSGVNGVKVYLYKPGASGVVGGIDQILLDSTITATNASGFQGAYSLNNLISGDYYVKFPTNVGNYPITPVLNQSPTTDANNDANATTGYSGKVTINVAGTGVQVNNTTIDAGYKTNIGSIGNYVWKDANADGLANDGAANGVNGVKVYLYSPGVDGIVGNGDDVLLDSTTTANDATGNAGYYKFANLTTASYYVKFPTALYASPLTTVNQAVKTDGNSDANATTGNSGKILLNTNSSTAQDVNNTTIDAGYVCNVAQPVVTGLAGYCPNDSVKLAATKGYQNYQWYLNGVAITGATDSIYYAKAVGNYTVTMQDPNACTSIASIAKPIAAFVTPPPPTINYTQVTACKDSGLSVCSSTQTFYQWYWNNTIKMGANNQCIYPDTTGYYKVKTFNATFCPSIFSDSVFITIMPTPKAVIDARSATTFCVGGSVMLCPLNFGFSNYRWFKNGVLIPPPPGNAACITITDSGYYQLQGTNGAGCWGPKSDSIKVTVVSTLATPTITGGPLSFCSGGNVVLTASASPNYQWYKDGVLIAGATSQTYTATQPGNYTVAVSAPTGCGSISAATTVTWLNPVTPTVTAAGGTNICAGGNVVLTSSSATGNQWYKDGILIAGATSQTYTATTSGNYSVMVSNGTCTSSSNLVTINISNPITPTIVANGGLGLCAGASVQLCPQTYGFANYQWYKNGVAIAPPTGTSACITVTDSGIYTLAASNGSNCWSNQSAAIVVTQLAAPTTPTITASGPLTFCNGGSVVLTSSMATGNQWYKDGALISGATSQTYTATQPGLYTVQQTGSNGCTSVSTAIVVALSNPNAPTIVASPQTGVCAGDSVTLSSSSATGNQWYKDGVLIPGATSQTYKAKTTGNYTVVVTSGGCSSTSNAISINVSNPIIPAITANGPIAICPSGSVQLCPAFYGFSNFQWYKNGVAIAPPTGTGACLTVTDSGSYTLAASNGSNCWSNQSTAVVVTLLPTLPAPTISASGPITFCQGGSVVLTSSATLGNQWFKDGVAIAGATLQTYTATQPGVYTVQQNNANSCSATSAAITVAFTNPVVPTITADSPTSLCNGGNVILTASAAANYQWYKDGVLIVGATSQTYTATTTGNYTVSTTSGGCTNTSNSVSVNTNGVATPSIAPADSLVICQGGTGQLCPASWGYSNYQWYKNGVTIAAPNGTASCLQLDSTSAGNYTLAAQNGAGCWSSQSTVVKVIIRGTCSVTGGGGGGVESKGLGDVIATRLYGNAINSVSQEPVYTKQTQYKPSIYTVNGTNNIKLLDLMPSSVINTDNAFISSPTDLTSFTNALEVVSVDFTKNSVAKAVAFGTRTSKDIYAHTKPICDRLREAKLLEVTTLKASGFDVIAYKILQRTGEIEYAINLSAGIETGNNNIKLQSNWFTNDYDVSETQYNFQLWATSYQMAQAMASDIITKLKVNGIITQANKNFLPAAYISQGLRNNTSLQLTIHNKTGATEASFELKEKLNENSNETIRKITKPIAANGSTILDLPINDTYESSIYMYINNKLSDLVYLSDGAWNKSFDENTTTLKSFVITNDVNVTDVANVHKLQRNVAISATTKDYVTLYKSIKGAGIEKDLSSYKALQFDATIAGSSKVKITLVKKGITDWKQQYSYILNLDSKNKYAIGLEQFTSTKFANTINANDIVSINFSILNTTGGVATINANVSNMRFTKEDVVYNNSLLSKALGIYPNPNTGKFNVSFMSEMYQTLVLKVVDANTGVVVANKFVEAIKGKNEVKVTTDNTRYNGLYIVTLEGDNSSYEPSKILISK
jgi:SdrD B-like domain/Secretion system C-terminal sorting domain